MAYLPESYFKVDFCCLKANRLALRPSLFLVTSSLIVKLLCQVIRYSKHHCFHRLRRGGTLSPTTLSPSHLSPQREPTKNGKLCHQLHMYAVNVVMMLFDQSGVNTVVGVADGDGSEVQVAQIDFSKEEGGDSPLPGQVPREDNGEEVETAFKQDSRGHLEEDRIQLQEEISLNYQYSEIQLCGSHTTVTLSLSPSLSLSLSPLPSRSQQRPSIVVSTILCHVSQAVSQLQTFLRSHSHSADSTSCVCSLQYASGRHSAEQFS